MNIVNTVLTEQGLHRRTWPTRPSPTSVRNFSQYHGPSSGSVHEEDRQSDRGGVDYTEVET